MSFFLVQINLNGEPAAVDTLHGSASHLTLPGVAVENVRFRQDGTVGAVCANYSSLADVYEIAQPFTLDGEFYFVGEARVDGRAELVRELKEANIHPPADCPDCRLILHAYQAWGEECLNRVIGDYSFVIWDNKGRRILCAHDHFGVGQIYYYQNRDRLIVSNSLYGLLGRPEVPVALDEAAIGDILLFMFPQDQDRTIYSNVKRLIPGCCLKAEDGEVRLVNYYDIKGSSELWMKKCDPMELTEEFGRLFKQAVKDRIRTDRLSVHLSGGLDSGSIAAIAGQILRETGKPFDLQAYSIAYRELIPDKEDYFAGLTAEFNGIKRQTLEAEDYILGSPDDEPAWIGPQPIVIPSLVAENAISEKTSRQGGVLLVGFGGDPLFEPEGAIPLTTRLFHGGFAGLGKYAVYLAGSKAGRTRTFKFFRNRITGAQVVPRALPVPWLDEDFVARTGLADRWREVINRPSQRGIQGMLRAPLWSFIFMASTPEYTSLPFSQRYPFFDRRLIDFCVGIPVYPWRRDKRLLREAMKEVLPEQVRTRPKTALQGNPGLEMMKKNGPQPWMKALMTDPIARSYIDPGAWESAITGCKNGDLPLQARMSWQALTFLYWLKCFYKNNGGN